MLAPSLDILGRLDMGLSPFTEPTLVNIVKTFSVEQKGGWLTEWLIFGGILTV
jgi:hypothetical protein